MRGKKLVTAMCAGLMVMSLAGCGAEETPIVWDEFSPSAQVSECGLDFEKTHINALDASYDYYEEDFEYVDDFLVQVDDKEFHLGQSTLGEVIEAFTGVSVKDQIKEAKGELEEETKEPEEDKAKDKKEKKDKKDKKSKEAQEEPAEPVNPYSYLYYIDGKKATYSAIQLVNASSKSEISIVITKNGYKYAEFIAGTDYTINKGVSQVCDYRITKIDVPKSESAVADTDGKNKYAKVNMFYNGGNNFAGNDLEFYTLPNFFNRFGYQDMIDTCESGTACYYQYAGSDEVQYILSVGLNRVYEIDRDYFLETVNVIYNINMQTQEVDSVEVCINSSYEKRYDSRSFYKPFTKAITEDELITPND